MLVPIDQYKKGPAVKKVSSLKMLPPKPRVVQPVQRPDIRQSENYKNAVSQADKYAQESQQASSFRGMAGNAIKSLPSAVSTLGREVYSHPVDTARSVVSGVYEGGIKPIAKLPTYLAGSYGKQSREGLDMIGDAIAPSNSNQTQKDIRGGFKFAGAVAPYELAGSVASKVLPNAPKLASLAGYVGGGQLAYEGENTAKDRGKQALMDSLLFGLTKVAGKGLDKLKTAGEAAPYAVPNIPSNRGTYRTGLEPLPPKSSSSAPLANELPIQSSKTSLPLEKVPTAQSASYPLQVSTKPSRSVALAAENQTKQVLELPVTKISQSERPYSANLGSIPENVNTDPISKITEALKVAKPLEKQQAAIYSAERAKRVARMVAAGKTPGEQGYFAQLGALKGQLPKVQFESIRKNVSQGDIDHLFNTVESHKLLTPFEKITAKSGLAKLLGAEGGQVPTKGELQLLGEVFPEDFMKQIMEKRPLMEKVMSMAGDVLNVPRSLMASFDLSAPLRQGIFLIGKPKQWGPAFKDMFKYAFSEKAYQGLTENIQSRATYQLMRENKLALTDMSKFATKHEEQFMSNLAEKIPGIGSIVRGSDRAYSGFLNKLRADVFDDLVGKLGKDQAPDIARFVNSATGRGELPKLLQNSQQLLNGAFFSPRLIASRVNLLNPFYYQSLSAPVRKEAIKSLLTFGSTVATVLGLAKLSGAEVGTDPRSADFAKIKVGDTRYDILGGFQQYAVLAYRLATNESISSTTGREFRLDEGYNAPGRTGVISRFLQSKESPIVGFIAGALSGKDSMGNEFKAAPEIIDRLIPMLANDIEKTIAQEGVGTGLAMQAPALFGVGTNTYTDQIPVMETTPTGKPTVKWNAYPSIGQKAIDAVTGTETSNIPEDQWKALYDERLNEQKRQVELDKAKQMVLVSGEPQYVGDTKVYLENGIVKTKKESKEKSLPLKDKLLYEELQKRKAQPFFKD